MKLIVENPSWESKIEDIIIDVAPNYCGDSEINTVDATERIIEIVKTLLQTARKEVLDYIADNQGWEETRDIYAEELGLRVKYPKLLIKYKNRNNIK